MARASSDQGRKGRRRRGEQNEHGVCLHIHYPPRPPRRTVVAAAVPPCSFGEGARSRSQKHTIAATASCDREIVFREECKQEWIFPGAEERLLQCGGDRTEKGRVEDRGGRVACWSRPPATKGDRFQWKCDTRHRNNQRRRPTTFTACIDTPTVFHHIFLAKGSGA